MLIPSPLCGGGSGWGECMPREVVPNPDPPPGTPTSIVMATRWTSHFASSIVAGSHNSSCPSSSVQGSIHAANRFPAAGLHADRAPGRHRHHRRPDRPACCRPSSRPARPRGGRSASTTSSSSAWPCTTTSPRPTSLPAHTLDNSQTWGWFAPWTALILPSWSSSRLYNALNFNLPMLELGFISPFVRGQHDGRADRRSRRCSARRRAWQVGELQCRRVRHEQLRGQLRRPGA